jgi:hypothetical protein
VYQNRMKKYFASQKQSALPVMVAPWPGFMLVPMAAFSMQIQQAILCQRMLYELAYAAAEEEVWFYRDGLSDFSI